MLNNINEDSAKVVSKYLFTTINHIFPGVFFLEFFFKKGLFSCPPQTIFEFSLLIFWSVLFSLPYNVVFVITSESFKKNIFDSLKNKKLVNNDQEKSILEDLEQELNSELMELNFKVESFFQFIFIIFNVSIFLLISYLNIYTYLEIHSKNSVFYFIFILIFCFFMSFYILKKIESIMVYFSVKYIIDHSKD